MLPRRPSCLSAGHPSGSALDGAPGLPQWRLHQFEPWWVLRILVCEDESANPSQPRLRPPLRVSELAHSWLVSRFRGGRGEFDLELGARATMVFNGPAELIRQRSNQLQSQAVGIAKIQ